MNFVLHWWLARRATNDPLAAAGAMLPDVWRMADRGVRARDGVRVSEGAEVARVLAGIEHHLEVDRWFHAAPMFVDGERLVAHALRATGSGAPKLGLFAHVTWEMLLDGALLRREGIDGAIRELDADVRATLPHAHAAASAHHFDAATEEARSRRPLFDRRVERLLAAIAEGPWIAGYRDGDGIVDRLEGVRRRFGLAPFSPEARRSIARALDELAPRASSALDETPITRG